MGRKCAVPHCYTGYRKCKDKASLYRVPDDDFFLNKWQEAIAREDRPITPKDYVCDKHFKDDDILRRRIIKDVVEEYQRPRLKPDAVPSIFPDLPEFILKMVKKRRKMPLKVETNDSLTNDKSNNEYSKEQDVMEAEIKTERIEGHETENLASTMCEPILNNELNIKSESEEDIDNSMGNEEENEKIDSNIGPKMHQCNQCNYQTKYPHNLRTHKTKHLTGEEAYLRCEHCPKFKTKWELTHRNHLKIKHGIGKQDVFKCNLCAFETRVKLCLKRHYERHQRDFLVKSFACDFPGCDFKEGDKGILALHKLSHGLGSTEKSKSFKCTKCLYETNSKTHIIHHIKTTHNTGDDTVVSVNTDKQTAPESETPLNDSKGKGKAFYKCLQCSYKTRFQGCLLKHVFKHNCQKTTTDKQTSNVWKCPKCPFATFFQHALEKHHETGCANVFLCEECNFKSNSKSDFITHSLTHRNISVESVKRSANISNFEHNGKVNILPREMNKESIWKVSQKNGEANPPEFVIVKSEIEEV